MTTINDLNRICRTAYEGTKEFYASYESGVEKNSRLGYKILYGPPLLNPPILFLGYQPGGGREAYECELKKGAHDGWPKECEYAVKEWRLAEKMQKMFGGKDFLKQCVGLNAIFIRSQKIKDYFLIDQELRKKIESFCGFHVDQMIEAMQPQKIVVIGFKTLDLYGGGNLDLISIKNNRVLAKEGQIAGHKATAVLHLSGARISKIDFDEIGKYINSTPVFTKT